MSRNESVIFCVFNAGRILCELREFQGNIRPCILGGSIEDEDRKNHDYLEAAVRREVHEELGVIIKSCDSFGYFDSDGVRFHVLIVRGWDGQIGQHNNDNMNKLVWIDQHELISSIELIPLKELLQRNLTNNLEFKRT